MRDRGAWIGVGLVLALIAGCDRNLGHRIASDPQAQTQVMDAIASSPSLTATMADKLLANPQAAGVLLDRVSAHGDVMQAVLNRIARDPAAIDGLIAIAVADSGMRDHVFTLFRGMQMGASRP